ncbi:hypothetical protein [Actinomadura harenae]|uniref:Uncharacterized protein n=1 Tax=Actinomadura harenae TaxID=2483351 RepID=A0A3M2M8Z1_9ACTN|nr:hypothetical protein [Actinomadura harenae]RMI45055.1 hypothetical protein EBO15_10795 [Actinomadura harenae]
MGYPGDTGKNGGWPSEQPPRQPHGPGGADPAPVSWDDDQNRLAPGSFGAPPGGLAHEPPRAASGPGDPNGTAALGDPNGTAALGGQPPFGGSYQGFDDVPQGFGGAAQGDHNAFGGPQQGFGAPQQGFGDPQQGFGDPQQHGFAEGGGFGGGPGGPDDRGPGGFGGPGGDGFGGGPDQHVAGPPPGERKKKGKLPLIIGGAAVAGVVLIGGGVAAASMFKGDSKPKANKTSAANKPAPKSSSTPSASPSQTLSPVKLKTRATDPSPLTLSEVFGKSSFSGAGEKFKRTGWNAAKTCTGAVGGTALTSTVKKGGCSQVLRATYTRGDGKLIGTVGVFNLKTETAAKAAVRAAAAKDAYLKPLPGAGNTRKIGTGLALGTAEARGHYLVMTWVQRPDGKKIADSAHTDVSDFGQQVIKGSGLGVALHYRETEGKPLRS